MLKILLFPISLLYDIVTTVRNYLYDRGLKPSIRFNIPVINIGNLTVGGTGKTPMVEYLIRLLSPAFDVATLSRGYGRKTRGFRLATEGDSAETLGDEPLQLFRKFKNKATVTVGEERALAIPMILQEKENVDIILLDDAFQHRRVRPSFNILLCDYTRPFYNDSLLPGGRLRESRAGAARADVVIVTKTPADLSAEKRMEIEREIHVFAKRPVFFSSISYSNPLPLQMTRGECNREVVLVTGIANPLPLLEFVRKNFVLVKHFAFRDHHKFTENEIRDLVNSLTPGLSILMTEKDMVKIDVPAFHPIINGLSLFFLPITVQFLKEEADFDEMILEHVASVRQKNLQ